MEAKYPKTLFNIVLIEPEIPNNTGNIGRTCVGLWSKLHLVGQLGFEITDTRLKRAGLDYWPHLDYVHHKTWEDWWQTVPDPSRVFFFSKKVEKSLFDARFQQGDYLVFGKETKGLSDSILEKYYNQTYKIPCLGEIRSFNLANAVSMAIGESYRQVFHR